MVRLEVVDRSSVVHIKHLMHPGSNVLSILLVSGLKLHSGYIGALLVPLLLATPEVEALIILLMILSGRTCRIRILRWVWPKQWAKMTRTLLVLLLLAPTRKWLSSVPVTGPVLLHAGVLANLAYELVILCLWNPQNFRFPCFMTKGMILTRCLLCTSLTRVLFLPTVPTEQVLVRLWLVATISTVVCLLRCVPVASGRPFPAREVVRFIVCTSLNEQGLAVAIRRRVPMTCDDVTSLTVCATPPAVRIDWTWWWKMCRRVFTG